MNAKTAGYYNFLIGLCDASTGLLLMAAPLFTLRLMMIPELPAEPVYLRFIGAFVFGVGASYWLPYLKRKDLIERRQQIITTWQMTALVRTVVGGFVCLQVLSGALPLAWISVAATDLGLAAAQLIFLRRGIS